MRAHRINLIGIIGAVAAALLTPGCNSSSDNNSSTTTDQSATGVWSGSDSVSGLTITAFINSAGQASFMRSDGVQFDGTAQVSGNTLAVTVDGYTNFPGTFSDGSTYGLGTVNGSVTTGGSITATLSFTTNDGTSVGGAWSLTYQSVSNNTSSTAAVSANYTDSVTGAVLSITSNGDMTEQNASNSCVLNGSISTSDSSYDVYQVAYSFGNCTGTYAVLNGVQFTGLASLNTSVSPAQLVIAVTGANSTSKYAIISILNGST